MNKILLFCLSFLTYFTLNAQYDNGVFDFNENDNAIELNIKTIDNYYGRLHLLYCINNDNRFMMTSADEYGLYYITNNDEVLDRQNFKDVFDTFYRDCYADFCLLDKMQISELEDTWKSSVSDMDILSLMMDIMMRNAPRGSNDSCYKAEPFCTDNGLYTFQAMTGNHPAESGPVYHCLGSQPCPSWYYMKIAAPGAFRIHMIGKDGNTERDIDFCCWGPYDDPMEPCPNNPNPTQNGLTQNKVVSCSFSTSYDEYCQIPSSAQSGEYYILVITNYSKTTCVITFEKEPDSGQGTTDCSIMPPVIDYSNACYGSTMQLTAQNVSNATYSWTGPNGFTSNIREPHIDNVTFANSGTYYCSITVPGQGSSDPMTIDIEVLPELHANFTTDDAVPGAPTQFTGTETTSPAGYDNKITEWIWDFGDGSPEVTGQNPTHVYANSGTYNVTYTVIAENATGGTCEDSKTLTVAVSSDLSAIVSCDDDFICEGEETTMYVSASGGAHNYTYNWIPAEFVSNPTSATTTVHPDTTTTFTCTVSDGYNSTDVQYTVEVGTQYTTPVPLDAGESCEPYVITYFNHQTQQIEQLVFEESTDEIINIGTVYGCDSVVHLTFVKYDEPYAPLINGVDKKEVMAGSSWMPLQYKFELDTVTGAGIEEGIHPATYSWDIKYHVDWTGIDNTGTWILIENESKSAMLIVLGPGNATISCDISTFCGTLHREIFVYTEFLDVDDVTYDERVSIYPNPANKTFYINFDESVNSEDITVCIYNTAGILIDTFTAEGQTSEYSTNELANGLYFIKVTGKDVNIIKRLVVNK